MRLKSGSLCSRPPSIVCHRNVQVPVEQNNSKIFSDPSGTMEDHSEVTRNLVEEFSQNDDSSDELFEDIGKSQEAEPSCVLATQLELDDLLQDSLTSYDPCCDRLAYANRKDQEMLLVHTESVFDGGPNGQTEIEDRMRAILVDWLVEICEDYSLQGKTLFLTITLLDKVIQVMTIRKSQFQLVGCTCLIIASKLIETQHPLLASVVDVAANCFTIEDLLEMEQRLLKLVTFDVNLPTRIYFADYLSLLVKSSEKEANLINFLLELSLLDYSFTQIPMSLVASGAVHLARQVLRPLSDTVWTPLLAAHSSYSETDLVDVVNRLQRLHYNTAHETNQAFRSIFTKYETKAYHHISTLVIIKAEQLRFDFHTKCIAELENAINSRRTPTLLQTGKRPCPTMSTDRKPRDVESNPRKKRKSRNTSQNYPQLSTVQGADIMLSPPIIPSENGFGHGSSNYLMLTPMNIQHYINEEDSETSELDVKFDSCHDAMIFKVKKAREQHCIHHESAFRIHAATAGVDINEDMRAILVDWMIEICECLELESNTLFLTIHLLDGVLRLLPIRKTQFHLIGCGCLIIAAKFLELDPPSMTVIIEMTGHCFSIEDLLEMEQRLLKLLTFDVNLPTRDYFADRLIHLCALTVKESAFIHFLLELSLLDYSFTQIPMSLVASGAVHLARQVLRPLSDTVWTPLLAAHSSYSETDLVDVVNRLQQVHYIFCHESNELKSPWVKYSHAKYERVSRITATKPDDLRFGMVN